MTCKFVVVVMHALWFVGQTTETEALFSVFRADRCNTNANNRNNWQGQRTPQVSEGAPLTLVPSNTSFGPTNPGSKFYAVDVLFSGVYRTGALIFEPDLVVTFDPATFVTIDHEAQGADAIFISGQATELTPACDLECESNWMRVDSLQDVTTTPWSQLPVATTPPCTIDDVVIPDGFHVSGTASSGTLTWGSFEMDNQRYTNGTTIAANLGLVGRSDIKIHVGAEALDYCQGEGTLVDGECVCASSCANLQSTTPPQDTTMGATLTSSSQGQTLPATTPRAATSTQNKSNHDMLIIIPCVVVAVVLLGGFILWYWLKRTRTIAEDESATTLYFQWMQDQDTSGGDIGNVDLTPFTNVKRQTAEESEAYEAAFKRGSAHQATLSKLDETQPIPEDNTTDVDSQYEVRSPQLTFIKGRTAFSKWGASSDTHKDSKETPLTFAMFESPVFDPRVPHTQPHTNDNDNNDNDNNNSNNSNNNAMMTTTPTTTTTTTPTTTTPTPTPTTTRDRHLSNDSDDTIDDEQGYLDFAPADANDNDDSDEDEEEEEDDEEVEEDEV